MKIYLIRHATAAPSGEGGDAARRLTDRGRREAEEAGRALRKRKASLGALLSSPLARARETAEGIAAAFDPPPPVELRETLASGAPPQAIFETARAASPAGEVALVGHQPTLGVLVTALTGESVPFQPSTICAIEVAADSSRVLWVHQPGPIRTSP